MNILFNFCDEDSIGMEYISIPIIYINLFRASFLILNIVRYGISFI